MAAMLNKVQLIGFLGRPPRMAYTQDGAAVANFSMATTTVWCDRKNNNKKMTDTTWHRIVAWRKLAETAQQFLRRGSQVYIEGRLSTRSYTWKDDTVRYVTEIIAERIQFLGPPPDQKSDPKCAQLAFELVSAPEDEPEEVDAPI